MSPRDAVVGAGRGSRVARSAAAVLVAALLVLTCLARGAAADVLRPSGVRPFDVRRDTHRFEFDAYRAAPQNTVGIVAADPGQEIELTATVASGVPFSAPTRGTVTLVSVTGATLVPGKNVYYPDGSRPEFFDVLPYTFDPRGRPDGIDYVQGAKVVVKVGNLDKKGRSTPVRLTVQFDVEYVDFRTQAPALVVQETLTFELPVTDLQPLQLSARLFSVHAGELSAGGRGRLQYTVESPSGTMAPLALRVRLPKGTIAAPGTVTPADGVVKGAYVTWSVPGPVSRFVAEVGLVVKARPGTKRTATVFRASARIGTTLRSRTEQLDIPIRTLDVGEIRYFAPSGEGGPVRVGAEVPFQCSGWDPDGGDIDVTLNDVGVATVPLAAPTGTFRVPPFRDPDLEHLLSARQGGKPADTVVTGEAAGECEWVVGRVSVTGDDGTLYRRLRTGAPIAAGEYEPPAASSVTQGRFGLVQIDGASSIALLRIDEQGPDSRLLFARGGEVLVHGAVRVRGLRYGTGKSAKSIAFQGAGDFAAYDPAGSPGVQTLVDDLSGAPVTITGLRRAVDWRAAGPVTFDGGLLYVEGDAEILGDVAGVGAIVVTGNLTHRGRFTLSSANDLVLGVGGTFATAP